MKKQNIAVLVGRSIRKKRVELGVSQDDFADSIDMHRAYYGSIERGEKNITVQTLHRVAVGLGSSMSEVLAGVDD
jgi:transcriptional regulator with XRE-family HTH domain